MPDFADYQSPFSWRYGSEPMRKLWSEHRRRLIWRRIWVALAEAQCSYGLVTKEQVTDLRAHMEQIDLERARSIEEKIQHDLMAEVKVFAEQAPIGGGIIHLGATSADIEDNAEALRIRDALALILSSLRETLKPLGLLIERYADTALIALTHLQPAEPSTLGYRLAQYAQDLLEDARRLDDERRAVRGKGFKGAVGTSASYAELVGQDKLAEFEQNLSERLGLSFYPVSTQTYPRKQDYNVLVALAGLGGSLYKMAFDLRLLQSPMLGELSEPFGERQVGSSAMPFKRNPVRAEKIDSLGRYLAGLPRVAWDNAAHTLLERTLDDSANRRVILPEAFLAADEMLATMRSILSGLRVDEAALQRNLAAYGPFAGTERVLMSAVKAGADRQHLHEVIRGHAMWVWEHLGDGRGNPLSEMLSSDPAVGEFLTAEQVAELMDYRQHLGNAPIKAREIARQIALVVAE
jgi:adenylosuccinate lyase